MTKIYDQNRFYTIEESRASSEYPENQVSIVGHGNSDDYYYDIYGTIKGNAIFEYNTKTFSNSDIEDCHVRNRTNKRIHVICSNLTEGSDSEATLGPNEEKRFDTKGYMFYFKITITVLDVETYNKSASPIRGLVS